MITIHSPNRVSLNYICQNLRQIDKTEIYPLMPYDSSTLLAEYTLQGCHAGVGKVVWCDGLPTSVVGLHPLFGRVTWQVFAFGTDNWSSCIFQTMRAMRQCIREVTDTYPEALRMQADSHEDHHEAHKWMDALKGIREAEMPFYGRDGATYYRYRWTTKEAAWIRFIEEAA